MTNSQFPHCFIKVIHIILLLEFRYSLLKIDINLKLYYMSIKVEICNRTACDTLQESRLRQWKQLTGMNGDLCSEEYCRKNASVGALVRNMAIDDESEYIVPLCHHHGVTDGELMVSDTTVFVIAPR